jgi:hypothetical protein
MPGIEHYSRKEAGGSLLLPPAQCASLLFSTLVEGGEAMILEAEKQRFAASPGFDESAFERLRFAYLAANIAVILTAAVDKNPKLTQVISPFRELVLRAMRDRWRDSEESADKAIEDANAAYAALVLYQSSYKSSDLI